MIPFKGHQLALKHSRQSPEIIQLWFHSKSLGHIVSITPSGTLFLHTGISPSYLPISKNSAGGIIFSEEEEKPV